MPVLRRALPAALAALAGGLLLTQAAGSSSRAAETCFGVPATIVGTPLADHLQGTAGNDVIVAGAGDDKVVGFGGNDLICGGPGDDTLNGGAGNDSIDGGAGTNQMYGGPGDDQIVGTGEDYVRFTDAPGPVTVDLAAGTATGEGNDHLSGIKTVIGSKYGDTIYGDSGDNFFFSGAGNDTFDGRGGWDAVFFSNGGPVKVDLALGTATGQGNDTMKNMEAVVGSRYDDRIYGSSGNDFLVGWDGADFIDGRGGNDVVAGDLLPGSGGNDVLYGGSGNDVLLGMAGDDKINGGPGNQDLAAYWYAKGVKADLRRGRVVGEGRDTVRGVEGIYGSPGADTLIGNSGPNLFAGDTGRDRLLGLGGDDFLDGGAGLDSVQGGKGQDYCVDGEKRSSCEIGGAFSVAKLGPARLGRLAGSAQPDVLDYGENPTCTTRIVSAGGPKGLIRRRRRHVAGVAPPGRVIPAVHRTKLGLFGLLNPRSLARASDDATDVTWRPVLYRWNGKRWARYKVFPELHATVRGTTNFAALWSDASGSSVARLSQDVGSGRYAWTAVTSVGGGPAYEVTREPHLNFGDKGGHFQQWCRF